MNVRYEFLNCLHISYRMTEELISVSYDKQIGALKLGDHLFLDQFYCMDPTQKLRRPISIQTTPASMPDMQGRSNTLTDLVHN